MSGLEPFCQQSRIFGFCQQSGVQVQEIEIFFIIKKKVLGIQLILSGLI